MANTYHQMYIHSVFAVKFHHATIQKTWLPELMGVIGNLINKTGCKTIIVNGTHDHVHCFYGLMPRFAVSDIMQDIKSKSSKWINENKSLKHRFEWQSGFGTFSYSRSHIDQVYQYIQNQEKHHQNITFREEYMQMLKNHGIQYEEKFIFSELV